MKVTNLINNHSTERPWQKRKNLGGDYAAEWIEAEALEGEMTLRSHFNFGDYIIVAEGGWKIRAVVCGTCKWASTTPEKCAVLLEDGDKILNKPEGLSFEDWREIASEIQSLARGIKEPSYYRHLKAIIKLARRTGDSPLARKAAAILAAAKNPAFFMAG